MRESSDSADRVEGCWGERDMKNKREDSKCVGKRETNACAAQLKNVCVQ